MSWLAKNVGSLGNLASRIAAEANGDNQHGTHEMLQQLNQELDETRDELISRQQEWERAKLNYEARLKSLTEGNATAQKVEQLEQKLNRAVELLKTLNTDKQNLAAKIKVLEEEKKEALAVAESAAAAAAVAEAEAQKSSGHQDKNGTVTPTAATTDEEESRREKVHALQLELKEEKEQHSLLVEQLNARLLEIMESNKNLEAKLEEQSTLQREESDSQADLSIQLEMAKGDLEEAMNEISMLKETNAKLVAKEKAAHTSPTKQPTPALAKELAEAKSTIAKLESQLAKDTSGANEVVALKASQKELQDTIAAVRLELSQSNARHSQMEAELSNSKAAQATLEKKEAVMAESITNLESELSAAKVETSAENDTTGSDEKLKQLRGRIRALEQELETSRGVFTEDQIEAVAFAIRSLMDSSREHDLPDSLTHDKILATWTRAKDEVDSYKDGSRSLEENLSRLRREQLEAQSTFKTKFEQFESEKTKELDAIYDKHQQAIAELEQRLQKDSNGQNDFDAELQALKLAEEESRKQLMEKYDQEKSELLASQEHLRQELEDLRKKYEEARLAAENSHKERETVIQDLERTVATNEQLLKTIRDDLQRTTNERNHFQSQHKTLLDRVSNMKSTIGTKLQADMENINTLRQQIDQLTAQNSDYLQTIKQLEDELMASHEHYEKTSRELEHLRRRLVDIQEDASAEVVEKENLIHELQSRLQREEREREDWETMAQEQRASKDQAIVNMRAMERERDAARAEKESLRIELDREIESLNNLQSVLEEFQSAKESEIQFALEGLQRQLHASNVSLEEYQGRAQAAEEQLRHLTVDVERARQLEREVKEKNLTIGKLRHDAVIQQGHLTEAMRRLKEENSQNTVDIPLISNLFISFLNIPRGDQKRFEILQLISGVLKFTDEQREQAGLIRKVNSGLGAMTPTTSGSRSPSMEQMRQHQEPKESFIDMWASFLIRESNANAASNNPNANSRSP
ncbi:hypothetical protein BGZ51_007463 [Haplosporangium sp. Z 767]|nr:hypothetical protein BGZ50_007528 [Haplosporangium sp. Z 11]KAF9178799.1 hypothetical protein BGZ51_007463 [Haplosporangium sp. Z 767]